MTTFASAVPAEAPPSPKDRAASLAQMHRSSLRYVLPLLAVLGLVRFWNLSGALGAWNEDEGTYAAQAWSLFNGELAHYTYWYDHPPFGWMQLAGWAWLTDAFGRVDSALILGRELVALYAVASGALLYVLCRRIGMLCVFSALAMVLFLISPLSLSWGRLGFLDNLTTPWVLGAMVLALSPRRSTSAAHLCGFMLAGAVLTKETAAMFVPVVFWMIWQNTPRQMRVNYLVRASTTLVSIGLMSYILLALLKGELLPGPGHVSLIGSLQWQLFDREGSGSIFNPDSIAYQVVAKWLRLDWSLLAFACLLLPVAAFRKRLRPVILAAAIHVELMLRGGYLPIPFIVVFLPLAAILVAGALDVLWRKSKLVTSLLCVVVLVATTPHWYGRASSALTVDDTVPLRSAITWLETNAPASAHPQIIGDDNVWPDLVLEGRPRTEVDWFYKLDADADVMQRYTPQGGTAADAWKSIDYVVIPSLGQAVIDSRPTLKTALAHSILVASFGTKPGPNYQVYEIQHDK